MNLQRREEIRVLIANKYSWLDDTRPDLRRCQEVMRELLAHIDTLEQTAAERVIRGGSSGPTPDYTGEGSAWVPPVEARAAVVPEHAAWLTIDEMANALVLEFGTPIAAAKGFAKAIADASIAKGSRAIPADRVLGDGMVAVKSSAIEALSRAVDSIVIMSNSPNGSPQDRAVSVLCMAFSPIFKALRANQGGAAT